MRAQRWMPLRRKVLYSAVSVTVLPGFSYADANGKFTGIDVDVCRGVAAAVLAMTAK
jgi:ABC-type amino acid transport substrate-binding protein